MYFFFSFFWIPASIAEAAVVIPNGAKTFFAKGVATFINVLANLLNNDPENPLDLIILEIRTLESFKSVDTLTFVFCLVVNNRQIGKI